MQSSYSWKNLLILFIVAFLIRATVFFFYIQHHERYRQADSMDYHICTVMLSLKGAMHHPQTAKPIFWRTPGYPVYLSWFYNWYDIKNMQFNAWESAQKTTIWFQIFLCSFTPILTFFLAFLLTSSLLLSWIVAWIFVFHIGFILASCYLLTDALAILFFFAFLLLFYTSFCIIGQLKCNQQNSLLWITFAALSLGLYTWLRPNGIFIAVIASFILLLANDNWQKKVLKICLFLSMFFLFLSPWYIRNYNFTGKCFFCPMSGPYLLAFSAPKILRRISNKPLDQCIKYLTYNVSKELSKQEELCKIITPDLVVPQELICGQIALPWIKKYPMFFLIDWCKEAAKTTFDLYGSQLVAFANNSYTYDPLEEFLTEKLQLCLYKQPMHWLMRFLCWLEALFYIFIWLGIFGGILIFLIYYSWQKQKTLEIKKLQLLWIKTGLMIGGLVFMTGGFGYARLRMPAEPLIIILSLTFWLWLIFENYKGIKSHGNSVCTVEK
ncbi:MAG: hypothetical protein WDZ41_03255 [Candidatus Babeliales bacterium]